MKPGPRHIHPITVLGPGGALLWTGRPDTDHSWLAHAACQPGQHEVFFPARGDFGTGGRGMCAHCPVRFACLEAGISSGATAGIWGGMAASGRAFKRLRRDRLYLARTLRKAA